MGQLNLSVIEIDRILGSGLKPFEKPLLLQAKELFFVPLQQPSLFCAKFCLCSSFLFFLFRIRVCLCHEAKKKRDRTNARIFAQFRPFLLASSQHAFPLSAASTAHSDYYIRK